MNSNVKKLIEWFKSLSKKNKFFVISGTLILFGILNSLGDKGLNGKSFIYMSGESNVGAVIAFDSEKSCSFFIKGGAFKNTTLGTYKLEQDNITFNWDKDFGPRSGKLIKSDDGKSNWKIDIGTAVYVEFKE